MNSNLRRLLVAIVIILPSAFCYKSCIPHKIDEEIFYTDEAIELKVVRRFDNLPLHFNGITYGIMCRGKNEWIKINSHSGLSNLGPDPSLETIMGAAMPGYKITDSSTLIFETGGFGIAVTWNACDSFQRWEINNIPDQYIDRSAEYDTCLIESESRENNGSLAKGWGEKNCRSYRFFGGNNPHFSDLNATRGGSASFKVSSEAFSNNTRFLVESNDYGKTWSLVELQESKM